MDSNISLAFAYSPSKPSFELFQFPKHARPSLLFTQPGTPLPKTQLCHEPREAYISVPLIACPAPLRDPLPNFVIPFRLFVFLKEGSLIVYILGLINLDQPLLFPTPFPFLVGLIWFMGIGFPTQAVPFSLDGHTHTHMPHLSGLCSPPGQHCNRLCLGPHSSQPPLSPLLNLGL